MVNTATLQLFMHENASTQWSMVSYFKNIYRKFMSTNTSGLEAHAGFFKLLMKEIFDPYVL